uniref:glycosyltransferase family 4 protein n=1 Tax=Pedobacter schmidteae TaxID=2201271 RepID=UPI000EACAE12|nr:glycosyltransferase family 4 protein [Pedobacter schmidteae]
MKIAFVSYEHPLTYSGGGIGTYIAQIAKLMASRGHLVEVFSAANDTIPKHTKTITLHGYLLHLIPHVNRSTFKKEVLNTFFERHRLIVFDIMESPEYGADGLMIKRTYPDLPTVVKLHTPTFLTATLNQYKNSYVDKCRYIVGGLVRGKLVKPYWTYHKNADPEFELYQIADAVSSPTTSLAKIAGQKWGTDKPIQILPNPFIADDTLLKIPPKKSNGSIVVSFIGRLEKRKGILDLMNAIPLILRKNPDITFRFLGHPQLSPSKGILMDEYLKTKLAAYQRNLEFAGNRPYSEIPQFLKETDICIFPSIWENFPNVCLEAMASGKAIVASEAGGMAEIIEHGKNGLLVPPKKPKAIAQVILQLAGNNILIDNLGQQARAKIIDQYNAVNIGQRTAEFYLSTIHHVRKKLACRSAFNA